MLTVLILILLNSLILPLSFVDMVFADAVWELWQSWGSCSRTCGGGLRTRVRICSTGVKGDCGTEDRNTQGCGTESCNAAGKVYKKY